MGNYVSFGCTNCGSAFLEDIEEGKKLKCKHCKREYRREDETEEQRNARILYLLRLDNAEECLRNSPPEFEEAEKRFSGFIKKYPKRYEGYWGLVRARYGIKLEKDINGKEVPSCYISAYEDFREDTDFKKALELVKYSIIYNDLNEKAELIANVCREWREEARKYSYDIFISFKDERKELGISDADRLEMENLYRYLWRKGYRKVFFSPISLEEFAGKRYDPYIFNALQTAKALIVYGSKPEYFTSTWVQNEWTRFLRMMADGEKKNGSCIVAYQGFNPKELPLDLRKIQAIDASKGSFYADVMDRINDVFKEEKKVDTNEELMRKIAELERKQAEEKKEEQRRQEEFQKQLEESKKQQEALKKSLDEEKKKNSVKINTSITKSAEEAKGSAPVKVAAPQAAPKTKETTSVPNNDFEIVGGRLVKYKGKGEKVTIPYGVTEIGEEAFDGRADIVSVTIPKTVKVIGEGAFYGCSALSMVDIPESVTEIGETAFMSCSALDSIIIPDSVTAIGDAAFMSCSNLTEVILPSNITALPRQAFEDCSKLTNIIIPKKVESIKDYAFRYCKALKNVLISSSVTTLGESVFEECSALESITIPESLTEISISAFKNCTSLKSVKMPKVSVINEGAFSGCSALAEIAFPIGITTIGDYAFRHCSKLSKISIPDCCVEIGDGAFADTAYYNDSKNWAGGILYIGKHLIAFDETKSVEFILAIKDGTLDVAAYAFADSKTLGMIAVPESVKRINYLAFANCSGLGYIELKNNISWVGDNAFSGCSSLVIGVEDLNQVKNWSQFWNPDNRPVTVIQKKPQIIDDPDFEIKDGYLMEYKGSDAKVKIPDGITEIGNYAFYHCYSLESVEIPSSVEIIGEGAFFSCDSLVSVEIPSSVEIIGERAFEGCSSLAEVLIPQGVTTISDSAFKECSSLNNVRLPNSVKTIGDCAFDCCDRLTNITIPNSVVTIGKYAFNSCEKLEKVHIGNGVTNIGDSAFSECGSLTDITVDTLNKNYQSIDGNLYTKDGTKLVQYAIGKKDTSFQIPYGVNYVGDWALSDCENLTSLDIPDSVITIGIGAFCLCKNLESVTMPDSIIIILDSAFYGCTKLANVTIPSSVTTIENSAFYVCTKLANVTIPSSVTTIKEKAFGKCDSLTIWVDDLQQTKKWDPNWNPDNRPVKVKVKPTFETDDLFSLAGIEVVPDTVKVVPDTTLYDPDFEIKDGCLVKYKGNKAEVVIPSSVTKIAESAFEKCKNITSITIPNSVFSIGKYAFEYCESLVNVTISKMVIDIGTGAFSHCNSLTAITVDRLNRNYRSIDGNLYTKDGTTLIQYAAGKKATSFEIPDGVTEIGYKAFSNCSCLNNIKVPNSVKTIGVGAFFWCKNLTEIRIPYSVKSIDKYAFSGCYKLSSAIFADTKGWFATNNIPVPLLFLGNAKTAASYLTDKFKEHQWTKK